MKVRAGNQNDNAGKNITGAASYNNNSVSLAVLAEKQQNYQTKHCPRCSSDKSIGDFYKEKHTEDGLHGWCKNCTKAAINKYRNSSKGKAKLQTYYKSASFQENQRRYRQSAKGQTTLKSYRQSPEAKLAVKRYHKSGLGKMSLQRAQKKYQEIYPDRVRCHWLFNKAIQRGKIIRPEICSACNEKNGTIHGHHPDYSKPYEVIWLCCRCHQAEHRGVQPIKQETRDKTLVNQIDNLKNWFDEFDQNNN